MTSPSTLKCLASLSLSCVFAFTNSPRIVVPTVTDGRDRSFPVAMPFNIDCNGDSEIEARNIDSAVNELSLGNRGPRVGIVLPEDENDDAWVLEVIDNSPAARAGLEAGDTITRLDGKAIKTVKQLRDALKAHKPGDEVKFTIRRSAKVLTITITLGSDASASLVY